MANKPSFRKLRGYAFDPSLSLKVSTALINNVTYKVPWEQEDDENGIKAGPIGEYVEVVDYDPTVKKFYAPVDLDDKLILAQDGLSPSASNPQFHQQMVYSVAMTTIMNFEASLGRKVLWSPRKVYNDQRKLTDIYVRALRIYPHAFRGANAYYSPAKKALLFGYFSAQPADIALQMPNNLTFTCLSHDIIAHETTHAILDGLHQRYTQDTNPDVLAFHEAFADIVALFQHFTFPEVLKNQIASTRGDLASQNLLGKLAQEFGVAIGNYGALRDAIGGVDPVTKEWKVAEPDGSEYGRIIGPHERGSVLVSAIFDAFLNIYKKRVADLLRIASGGTGVLQQGELHPDLVNRLASEASKASRHVLRMCIRAIDYCPPVDINFGDFLRAIITADLDLVPEDGLDYRLAFIEAFSKRGIYPTGIKTLSVESLSYSTPRVPNLEEKVSVLVKFLRAFRSEVIYAENRLAIFKTKIKYITGEGITDEALSGGLHKRLSNKFEGMQEFERLTGMMFSPGWDDIGVNTSMAYGTKSPSFGIPGLHLASRVGPTGNQSNQIIVTLMQRANLSIGKTPDGAFNIKKGTKDKDFGLNGGCTLIFDLDTLKLKYVISKPLLDVDALKGGNHVINRKRCMEVYDYQNRTRQDNQYQAYFGAEKKNSLNEPFNFLHNH